MTNKNLTRVIALLLAAAALFAPCHILLSYKNAALAAKKA